MNTLIPPLLISPSLDFENMCYLSDRPGVVDVVVFVLC